eukprot:5864026-Prymnesium_polylepis.3
MRCTTSSESHRGSWQQATQHTDHQGAVRRRDRAGMVSFYDASVNPDKLFNGDRYAPNGYGFNLFTHQ